MGCQWGSRTPPFSRRRRSIPIPESIGKLSAFAVVLPHPRDVAEVVLKVVNTPNPNVRYHVGKDAESVLKKKAELSDMEMEKWVRESFLEKKGFIR